MLRTSPQTRPAANLSTAARERKSLSPTIGSAMQPPRYTLPMSETTAAAVSNLVAAFRPPAATQAATAAAYEIKNYGCRKSSTAAADSSSEKTVPATSPATTSYTATPRNRHTVSRFPTDRTNLKCRRGQSSNIASRIDAWSTEQLVSRPPADKVS